MEIDLNLTPDEYKKLWWEKLYTKLPSVFTLKELQDILSTYGVVITSNLQRYVTTNTRIEAIPGVQLRVKAGRPPTLYRLGAKDEDQS